MKNLKIRLKLLLGFGVVLVMLATLGAISFVNVGNLGNAIDTLTDKSIPETVMVWQMRRNMISVQRHIAIAVAAIDIETINKAVESAIKDRGALDDAFKSFKQVTKVEPSLISNFENTVGQTVAIRDQIISLVKTLDAEDNKKALDLFVNTYVPLYDKAAECLIEISDAQDNLVKHNSSDAKDTVMFSNVVSMALPIVAIIIGIAIVMIITNSISKPIIEAKRAAEDIASGNLNVNLRADRKDEIGDLIKAFIKVREVINLLTDKLNVMSQNINAGDLDAKIEESLFEGEYRSVAKSINETISSLIEDTLAILNAFNQLGEGNFNSTLRQFPGKKAVANEQFEDLKRNLSAVSSDVNTLILAAGQGQLDKRVDSSLYHGDWYKLTEGINNLLHEISTPIADSNAILSSLSQGNFDVTVNKSYKGSFGAMMNAFDVMVNSTKSYINEITDILGKIAGGDLTQSISREYVGQYNYIKESINNISTTLQSTITEIKTSSDNVLAGAQQISESAMDLANGASSQASSVEELNASILTINDQTRKTATDAKTAHDFSLKSMENAKSGSEEMLQMLDSMNDIKSASNNISKIIKVIDDISFQTNILALNAAVEAARAGVHGKGFAVVAEEVRTLAGRSQQAAKDTSALIEDTIKIISDGTNTAQLTADSLNRIVNDINSVSVIIDDIFNATKEQSDGISQVTIGINQISEIVQKNSSTSEESAAAAQELNSQSVLLAQMVNNFRI